MSVPTKIRATVSGNVADVKILITHPMENGLRKGADGKLIPANFIRNLTVSIGGKTFLDAEWGGGVSKDPYLSFRARGVRAGDKVLVAHEDNFGNKGSTEATVG
jgi:sulfur-oxidizing protein SoxZ